MMWAAPAERVALAVLGAALAVGIGARTIQQHHAPLRIEPAPAQDTAAWDAQVATARRVDVNAATAEELERLPGIGPATAERIVAYRRAHGAFAQVAEVRRVPGVAPSALEALNEFVTVTESGHAGKR